MSGPSRGRRQDPASLGSSDRRGGVSPLGDAAQRPRDDASPPRLTVLKRQLVRLEVQHARAIAELKLQILDAEEAEAAVVADPNRLLTSDEAAAYIGKPRNELYRPDGPPKLKAGGLNRYRRADLDRWLAS